MRPSLAAQRQSEMLVAIEACIREVGVGGLTTQLVAEKSGYSRSHIRHYLGNKDDQLRALLNLYTDRYARSLESIVESTPFADRRDAVLRELFGDTWMVSHPEDDMVLVHLSAFAASNPQSGFTLFPMYERILEVVVGTLDGVTDRDDATNRSRLVLSLAYGVVGMRRMGIIDARAALNHARALMLLPTTCT